MPKALKPKRGKRAAIVPGGPISAIGTKRWRESVPPHLQAPLGKALHAMESNDLAGALHWFGECMERIPNTEQALRSEAKPVLYFGGQVASQGYFSLRGRDPFHPELDQWRQVAQDLCEAAWEADPGDAVACHNAARFHDDIGNLDEAIGRYRHTLMLDSSQVETWGNLGTAYYRTGDTGTAWECWNRCVSLTAAMASGLLSQAYIHLRKGEYAEGWAKYNARWKDLAFAREYGRDAQFPHAVHWMGEPLPKRARLFLHGEQGLGDHLQFARFIPLLAERGITVVGLETRAPLVRWMQACFPNIPVVDREAADRPAFTHHCSTMDLPGILGITFDAIPAPVNPSEWSRATGLPLGHGRPPRTPRRVGIAWEGAKGNTADSQRSIPPELLQHLAGIPNVQWVNLQYAPHGPMTAAAWLNAIDGTEGCADFLDTAAVMRGLDLVITVDTATAHAAGTLGIPTWILHRYCREWRWGDLTVTGETCPWYPSVRSLTQTVPGDWDELLSRVRTDLTALAATP